MSERKRDGARPVVVAILAGGTGRRTGGDLPKQFLPLAGKPVVAHAVEAFERNAGVDEIVIVCHADWLDRMRSVVEQTGARKVRAVLAGGAERYDSSMAAIRYCGDREVNLLLHDAARPLVTQRIIGEVCARLAEGAEAVNVTLPVVDTIVEVADGRVVSTPDRSRLRRVQTPQGFRLDVIRKAYALALADPAFRATDDFGVVARYLPDAVTALAEGDERNLKLTYREDLTGLEALLASDGETARP